MTMTFRLRKAQAISRASRRKSLEPFAAGMSSSCEQRCLVFPGESAAGNRIQKRLGVGVLRTAKDIAGQTLLHHLTVFHDSNEVANLRGHPEVVRNKDDGETESLSQPGEKLQYLRLHGHVECGNCLVRDQNLGAESERAGKTNTLALTTGEFVRKAVDGRWIEPDKRKQLLRLSDGRCLRGAVHDRTLGDQVSRLAPRVKRRKRILKHHLNMAGFPGVVCSRHLRPHLVFDDKRTPRGVLESHDSTGRRPIFPARLPRHPPPPPPPPPFSN